MKLPFAAIAFTLFAISPACISPCCETQETQGTQNPDPAAEARLWLDEFGEAYHYNVGYLQELLALSPAAYEPFAAAMGMGEIQNQLPLEAHYIGVISALLADDCGECTQLMLRMAVEAGVERESLRILLEEPGQLPSALRNVQRYAHQVVKGQNADASVIGALKETYGDEAFGELAVNVIGARIYPALRRAMGAETVCPPPTLDF